MPSELYIYIFSAKRPNSNLNINVVSMTNLSKSQLNKLHEKERKRLEKIKQFEVKQSAETLTVSEGLSQQKIRILGEDKFSQIRQLNELNTEN